MAILHDTPTVLTYHGATYHRIPSPPAEVHYRGAKYVLAVEDETPVEKREPLREFKVHIPSVVTAYNYLPGIKACLDPFVWLSGRLLDAYQDATFRTKSDSKGLKWIIDAGYDAELRERLANDPDRTVAILDGFLDSFALMDAYADRIYELMQMARKEILSTEEIKMMLPDADSYDRLVNSAKATAAKYNIESSAKFASRALAAARQEGEKANKRLQGTTDKQLKQVTSPDGTVTVKARSGPDKEKKQG